MRPFTAYIEYLLVTQHYCYVPGRGAYMIAEESHAETDVHTSFSQSQGRLTLHAPESVVRFCPLHSHDDGQLISLLIEVEGMTYEEARRFINRQVQSLPEDYEKVVAPRVSLMNLGFSPLQIEPWSNLEYAKKMSQHLVTSHRKPSDEPLFQMGRGVDGGVLVIPLRVLRRAAVAVLIALFFFFNFIGLGPDKGAQLASVVTLSALQRGEIVHQTWDEDDEDAYASVIDTPSAIAELPEVDDVNENSAIGEAFLDVKPLTVMEQTSFTRSPLAEEAPEKPFYHIIVASVTTEHDAFRAKTHFQKLGFENAEILASEGRYRLRVAKFATRAEAEEQLLEVRAHGGFLVNAWILTQNER